MIIDHIGIVVRSIDNGIRQWKELFGYRQVSDITVNTRQKVKVVFLEKEGSVMIKLVEATEPETPTDLFARKGGGLHHLCFRCADIETQIEIMQDKGARCIVPPEPGEAFLNHDIAFLMARNNLNIELIDTDEKQGLSEV